MVHTAAGFSALAAAGFHAVAPDMRGYGQTDRPEAIGPIRLLQLVGDMVGLLDALGHETAVIAGHDWGAPVAWHAALLRPDRFRAVIGLSVPFDSAGPRLSEQEAFQRATTRYFIKAISRLQEWLKGTQANRTFGLRCARCFTRAPAMLPILRSIRAGRPCFYGTTEGWHDGELG